jgi:hypothetical protein
MLVQVRTSGFQEGRARLQWIGETPKMMRSAMREYGATLERDLKNSARQARIDPYLGNLYGNGIRWEQGTNSNTGKLYVVESAVMLDAMRPHGVYVRPSRPQLLLWALQARSPVLRQKAQSVISGRRKQFLLNVEPHPFIMRGYKRARSKVPAIIRRHVRAARERGR